MEKLVVGIRVFVASLAIGCWPLLANGQFRDNYDAQEWHYGKVVLATGDSLFGAVVYHAAKDVVYVESKDGAISSFSPVNVSHFVVNDSNSGRPHMFRSLFWNLGRTDSDFKMPVFFEQLNQGTISLIKRRRGESPSNTGMAESYNNLGQPVSEDGKEFYYALLPDGEIVALRNMRKDLHRLFGSKSDEVRKFVKSNKLDYNKPMELLTIVNYFNTL